MSELIRIGVVGVGSIGKNHARICAELPDAQLAAVFDINRASGEAMAARYGAKVANSLDEFISLIDAATVAAPTAVHYEIGSALLAQGKHVLIEKPITETTDQAQDLVRLAKERSVIL